MLKKSLFVAIALIFGYCTPQSIDPTISKASQKSMQSRYYSKFHLENFGFTTYHATTSTYEYAYMPLKNPTEGQKTHHELLLHSQEDINYGKFDNEWQIPHTAIQANHKKYTAKYWLPESEQLEAYMMLEKYLFPQKNTPEVQEAIAIYATWLLNNEAPEVQITQTALERLKGYWTKKQLNEAQTRLTAITEVRVIGFRAWRAEELRKANEQGKDYHTYFIEKQLKEGRGKMNPVPKEGN